MGYPMTWQRLVNRNRLAAGDYNDAAAWAKRVNTTEPGALGSEAFMLAVFPHVASRVDEYEQSAKNLLGDLRRLENDLVDERAICIEIATRTGLDADTVAAVLKEFVAL